jgi:hypothetical protein
MISQMILSLLKLSAMKSILFSLAIITIFSSCHFVKGSGNIISETRNVGKFTRISASHGFEVEFKYGSSPSVVVEADDNLMRYVDVRVDGDALLIGISRHMSLSNAHLKAYVTGPAMEGMKASSGADISSRDVLKDAGKLSFNASSAGTITAEVDAPEVKASASSGASIQLSGRTKSFDAESSSGASVKSSDLMSESTYVVASSGASAQVHASVSLEAKASSGADIYYRGNGSVRKTESSGGSVEKRN